MAAKLSDVGYYYQASYKFDDVVKAAIDSYGVVVSKLNMPGADFLTEQKGENGWTAMTGELTSGAVVNSGLLRNIMSESKTPEQNAIDGAVKVYANPYIVIKTGDAEMTLLVADEENAGKEAGMAMSLKDVLVAVDAYWANFADATIPQRLKNFYNTWADNGMSAWAAELPNMSAAE